MVTGSEEYKQFLASLASSSDPPHIRMRIPSDEPVYKVDWDKRKIEVPEFVGVESDHEAELIYFEMDRYYDQIDLASCIGFVQFKNAKGEEFIYVIPYYDITSKKNKIIFAWDIQEPATRYGGVLQFSFKFFKVNPASGELIYEINTLVAKTKVLIGWANQAGANHTYNTLDASQLLIDNELVVAINNIKDAADKLHVYWIDLG